MINKELLIQWRDALVSCQPGDYSTGHVIYPSFDEDAVEKALASLQAALDQPEPDTKPIAWPTNITYTNGDVDETWLDTCSPDYVGAFPVFSKP